MKNLIFKFQILAIVFLSFYACGDTIPKQRIPWTKVRFNIYLNASDDILANIGFSKLYPMGTSGIVIVNSPLQGRGFWTELPDAGGYLYAYDRCCPYEASPSIKVDVVDGGEVAVCPSCKTRYDLLNGGERLEGVGKYPLQNYHIVPSNLASRIYLVQN